MASTNFIPNVTVIEADWLNDVNAMTYGGAVNAQTFGVVGNGVTDDTLAMLAAWAYCRTNNKTLLIEGSIVFNAATVPSGSKFPGTGGDYVNCSSMMGLNAAKLLVNGKIGFSLTGVDQTILQGFAVTTTGREMTESSLAYSSPTLFASSSGSKTSAVYRDLVVYHTVTDLTGAYRASVTFTEYGCEAATFDNIKVSNSTIPIFISNSTNIVIRNLFGYNVQTNMFLSVVTDYQVTNAHLINTKQQADYWVQRTNASPLTIAGSDNLLIEQGDRGTVIGLHTEWPIERACYIQSSNVHVSDCYTLNGEGYKVVGTSYAIPAENQVVQNCHVVIDADWASTRGRVATALVINYLAVNVQISGCSILNTDYTRNVIPWAIFIGYGDGYTSKNISVKDCTAINAARLVVGRLSNRTAAQLAALIPAGSFVAVENLEIENCYIKHDSFGVVGSLFDWFSSDASADALAAYAGKNIGITSNNIEMTANTASWFFQPRWCDGVVSANNNVNSSFANGGFFASAVSTPYQNIKVNEPYLKHAVNSGILVDRLANLTVLAGSDVVLTGVISTTQSIVKAATYATAAFLDNQVVIEIFGKGYLQVNTTRSFGVSMNASGDFYFGKILAGVKTDQVSTPPITIDLAAGVIAFRGDSQPTVDYAVQMTLV